ncbi:MAG: hypothetical protein WC308_00410 [archaeon]|jgi:hypothetical protein
MFEMLGLVLKKTAEEYSANIKVAVSYLLLLVFVFIFVLFQDFYIASGTVFLSYSSSVSVLGALLVGLVFLYFFSFFVSLTIYSVRRDVQHMSLDEYWNELLRGSSLKIFLFYLGLAILFYILSVLGLQFGISLSIIAAIDLIVAFVLMYVPQSIVLDEDSISFGIGESIGFVLAQPLLAISAVLIGSFILAIIFFIEFGLDLAGFPGNFVSLVIVLVLLLPLIEQMKSYSYIMKSDLLRSVEYYQSKAIPAPKPMKINATRLREKNFGGKL